ncbi:MAG TPA: c-type cytochrome [Burkholderiales bacterium]
MNPLWHVCVSLALAIACFDALPAPAAGEPRQTPEALYHNYCSVCHGDRGDGKSRAANSLVPPPKSFVTPEALRYMTRETMIAAVRDGRPGTAMTGWTSQLDAAAIEAVVDYIRRAFMAPLSSPAVQRGRVIYRSSCFACHGEQGVLRSPQAAELTRERMAAAVNHGRQLKPEETEALLDYIRAAFMMPAAPGISGVHAHGGEAPAPVRDALPGGLSGDARRGREFYAANCATCHGAAGDGKGPRAYFINPKPRDFTTPGARAAFTRPVLYAAIAQGRVGSEMPAWDKVLTPQEIANVAEYVYAAFIRPQSK